MHISELAAHHVENPREVVQQGQAVNVRVLEIDGERRRLSLSLKRVEEGELPVPRADGAESVHTMPDLKLTEEAFPTGSASEVTDELVDEIEISEPAEELDREEASTEDEAEGETSEVIAQGELAEDEAAADTELASEPDESQPDETDSAA